MSSIKNKPLVKAKVTFIAPDKGGRNTPACSGTRSQLKVNDIFTSCVIYGETGEETFQFGVEYNVTLDLLFWDQCKDAIHTGMPVQLNEGQRIVGWGTVESLPKE